jgi:hypothetical protein
MTMNYMLNPMFCIIWCSKAAMNFAPGFIIGFGLSSFSCSLPASIYVEARRQPTSTLPWRLEWAS